MSSTTISSGAVEAIKDHQAQFSAILKLTNPKIKNAEKPERVKITLTDDQAYYFGDGSTMDKIRVFFLNLITLCIGYKMQGGNLFCAGDVLDKQIAAGEHRGNSFARGGIDDPVESDRFNSLHHLAPEVLEELIQLAILAKELKPQILNADAETFKYTKDGAKILHELEDDTKFHYLITQKTDGIYFEQSSTEGNTINPIKFMSNHAYSSGITLNEIASQLSPEARIRFQPYFALEERRCYDDQSPIVAASTERSTSRMILLGIQAGRVSIDAKNGIPLLAKLMEAEVKALKQTPTEEEGRATRSVMADLAEWLDYSEDGAPLTFMGEVAQNPIHVKMLKHGVRFIAQESEIGIDLNYIEKVLKENEVLEAKSPFKLAGQASYDKATKMLCVPGGLTIEGENIYTAVGSCKLSDYLDENNNFDVYNFVVWMNNHPLPKLTSVGHNNMAKFKPDGSQLADAAKFLKVTLVVARDDILGEHKNVIALQSSHSKNPHPLLAARIGAEVFKKPDEDSVLPKSKRNYQWKSPDNKQHNFDGKESI